jgi:DNA-binding transcriptional LysR family regulator
MKEGGSATRKYVDELFGRNGLTPNILMETSNMELIKQLVGRGDGISFTAREEVFLEIRDGTLVTASLEGGQFFLDICIAYL